MTTRHKARLSILESRQQPTRQSLEHLTDAELAALMEAGQRVLLDSGDWEANRCPPGGGKVIA